MNNMLKPLWMYINNELDEKVAYRSMAMQHKHAPSLRLATFFLRKL